MMIPASLLRDGVIADSVGNGIVSVLPHDERGSDYDAIACGYDALVGNSLYNRIVWKNWAGTYLDAANRALREFGDRSPILDCGCGSLVFTGNAYRTALPRDAILFDRSHAMLKRAARRLPEGNFVQGDALDLPFRDSAFAGAMCWGTLHVIGLGSGLLPEMRRVIRPGGKIALTSLVLADRFPGDRMLALLHRKGESAVPSTFDGVRAGFAEHFEINETRLIGNMAYLSGTRR